MSAKNSYTSKPGTRDIFNSCTKVVNDGKAFRNYRLLKMQKIKHEKYGSFSNVSKLTQSYKTQKLKQDNSKYKFVVFEEKINNKDKSVSRRLIHKTSKPINSNIVMDNSKLTQKTISGSSINVNAKKYIKNRNFKKRKHSKDFKVMENSQQYIIGPIESILKENEKFRSTPTKCRQVRREGKRSVISTSKNKIQKTRFKKSIECIQITNTTEKSTTSSLRQIEKGWTMNESKSKNPVSRNISLSSKRMIAKALFNGRSWIEGNKALEKSPHSVQFVNGSNLNSVLSKEIMFRTNNEKSKKPVKLTREICSVQNPEDVGAYTKVEHTNEYQNPQLHIEKQMQSKTSTDLLQYNYTKTNNKQCIIFKSTSKCSTDKENILKNEAEILPLNKVPHFNKGEIPFECFKDKQINKTNADNTLKATPTKVTPLEPHLKITKNSSSIMFCHKIAEPNLRLNKKESNFTKLKLGCVGTSNLWNTLNSQTTKSELDLKYSKGTTTINIKHPVRKTKNIFNPLLKKTLEHKINIFTNPNSANQISTGTFQLKTTQENTTYLQCYKENNNNDSKTYINNIGNPILRTSYKYSGTVREPLAALNNKVVSFSSLLPHGCDIDDVWQCVYQQFEDIKQCDHMYNNFQSENKTKFVSQSSPQLLKPPLPLIKNNNLLHALKLGLIQTQSENQVRLAVIPTVEEILHIVDVNNCVNDKSHTPPLEKKENIIPQSRTSEEMPILPRLIPVFETYDQPCTILKQQKKSMYNTPTRLAILDKELQSKTSITKEYLSVSPVNVFSPHLLKPNINEINSDLEREIKQLTEKTVQLNAVNLLRMKAQQNIHAKLVKEFDAADSLIEFQRQMKPINKEANKDHEVKNVQSRISSKDINNKQKPFKTITEELFVPEKRINKIAATNLNPLVKSNSLRYKSHYCQFLYKESKKVQHEKQKKELVQLNYISSKTLQLFSKNKLKLEKKEAQQKYSGSLLFSKKKIKLNKNLSSAAPVSILNSSVGNTSHSIYEIIHSKSQISNNQTDYLSQQATDCKTALDCFDILDEITLTDLKPLESEYPRKDHIPFNHYPCVQDTFLYKIVNNHAQNMFLESLKYEETSIECDNKNCKLCCSLKNVNIGTTDFSENEKKVQKFAWSKNKHSNLSNNQPSLIQNKALINGSFKNQLEKAVTTNKIELKAKLQQRAASTDSNIQSSRNTNKRLNKNKQHGQSKARKSNKLTQDDVIAKLRPYIFDPRMRYPTTITVMPVNVTTTYTNPNFIQNVQKHPSGDYAPSNQSGSDKYSTKPTSTNKTQFRNVTTKHTGKPLSGKKLWNYKYPKPVTNNLITYLEKQNLETSYQRAELTANDDVSSSNQTNAFSQKTIRKNQSPRLQTSQIAKPYSTTYNQQYQPQNSFFISNPSHLNTGIIEQVPQLHTSSISQQPHKLIKSHISTPKSTNQQTSQILNPTITIHTFKDENISKQNNKAFFKKTSLENNIQNVIDMIEGKIVDIISRPDQLKIETFDNVEKEIVEILKKIQGDESKHLKAIEEQDLSPRPRKDEKEIKKKSEKLNYHDVKTIKNQSNKSNMNNLHSGTCPSLVKTQKENDNTSPQSPIICSNDEYFIITSSCFPDKPNTPIKSDVNKNKSDVVIHVKGKPSVKCKQDKPVSPVNSIKTPTNKDRYKSDQLAQHAKDDKIQNNKREVLSDQLLTPFMKTLKKYRKDEHSIDVLEFLDTLTNISDDASLRITNKWGTILHYRHKLQFAQVFHNSEAFYPIFIYHAIVYYPRNSRLKSEVCSKILNCPNITTKQLNKIKKLFSYLNLFNFSRNDIIPVEMQNNHPYNPNAVYRHMDQVSLGDKSFLQNNSLNILNQEQIQTVQPIVNDDQHYIFLNYFYGMLFIAIFLSLTFNYTCQ